MTMITPSYLGETIEYSSLHACRSTLEDPTVDPSAQFDRPGWPALRARIAAVFATAPQADWTERFAGAEACGAPVLAISRLAADPHMAHRRAVTETDGVLTAAPAPRLSAHPDLTVDIAPRRARSAEAVLEEAGFAPAEVEALAAAKVIWSP